MLSLEVVRWNSRNIIPFRLAVGRYDAENQVCISLSDQVWVQTHVMMGIGDRQATPWHTTLNSPNLDQATIFRRGFLRSSAQRKSKGSSSLNGSACIHTSGHVVHLHICIMYTTLAIC